MMLFDSFNRLTRQSSSLGLRGMSMARFSTDASEMVPPVAEPGKSTVTVSVSARALVGP
jgi:hypothetical protein